MVTNCNSRIASRKECNDSSNISSFVDTDIFSLTGNTIRYHSFLFVIFSLSSLTSEIDSSLSLSFALISREAPLVIVKYATCSLYVIIRSRISIKGRQRAYNIPRT